MSDQSEPINPLDPLTVGELISLPDAAQKTGISHASLRRYAINGRLQAKKMGRDWFTTLAAIDEYKNSRHQGKKPVDS